MVGHHGTKGAGKLSDLSFKTFNSVQECGKKICMMICEKALDGAMKFFRLHFERSTSALLDFIEADIGLAADEELGAALLERRSKRGTRMKYC
jgi:hypothetical protein